MVLIESRLALGSGVHVNKGSVTYHSSTKHISTYQNDGPTILQVLQEAEDVISILGS